MENVIAVEKKDIGCQSAPCEQEKKQTKKKTKTETSVSTVMKEDIGQVTVNNQNENNPDKENVIAAKKKDTGKLNVPKRKPKTVKEENPKKLKLTKVPRLKITSTNMPLKITSTNIPLKKTTDVSTVTSSDMDCFIVDSPLKPESPSTNSQTLCSTNEVPCTMPENNDIGTGVEKLPNISEDTKAPSIEPAELTDDLAKAVIIPLGPRGFRNVYALPRAPWKSEAWTVVVMILGDLQDWKPDEAFQMLCGNMYWVPKCLRYCEWTYNQIMKMENE